MLGPVDCSRTCPRATAACTSTFGKAIVDMLRFKCLEARNCGEWRHCKHADDDKTANHLQLGPEVHSFQYPETVANKLRTAKRI